MNALAFVKSLAVSIVTKSSFKHAYDASSPNKTFPVTPETLEKYNRTEQSLTMFCLIHSFSEAPLLICSDNRLCQKALVIG